jgi:hypothetical protein
MQNFQQAVLDGALPLAPENRFLLRLAQVVARTLDLAQERVTRAGSPREPVGRRAIVPEQEATKDGVEAWLAERSQETVKARSTGVPTDEGQAVRRERVAALRGAPPRGVEGVRQRRREAASAGGLESVQGGRCGGQGARSGRRGGGGPRGGGEVRHGHAEQGVVETVE